MANIILSDIELRDVNHISQFQQFSTNMRAGQNANKCKSRSAACKPSINLLGLNSQGWFQYLLSWCRPHRFGKIKEPLGMKTPFNSALHLASLGQQT